MFALTASNAHLRDNGGQPAHIAADRSAANIGNSQLQRQKKKRDADGGGGGLQLPGREGGGGGGQTGS